MKRNMMPLMVETALRGHLCTRLAADAKLDLKPVVTGLTAKTWLAKKAGIKVALDAAIKKQKVKFAKDATLGDVTDLLDNLDDVAQEIETVTDGDPAASADPGQTVDDPVAVDDDAGAADRLRKVLESLGMAPDDIETALAALKPEVDPAAGDPPPPAADDDPAVTTTPPTKPVPVAAKTNTMPPGKGAPAVNKPAMDAAIAAGVKLAVDASVKRIAAIATATAAVQPYIGELKVAADAKPADIYKMAFDAMEVDVTGVHESAFPAMLKLIPAPGSEEAAPKKGGREPLVAMDAADTKAMGDMFPGASHLKRR